MMKFAHTAFAVLTYAGLLAGAASVCTLMPAGPVAAQSYAPMYEAPWSSPAPYEYQYTQAEGVIPPSYYDYTPVNTSGYAMSEYLTGAATNAYYTVPTQAYDQTFTTGYDNSYFDYGVSGGYAQPVYYQAAPVVTAPAYTTTQARSELMNARVMQCAPGDTRWRADEIGQGTAQYYVDGSSNTTRVTNTVRPTCRLYPKSTNTATVILEWVTTGATTAFIDNGIGHVSLGTGGRMVTPTQSTVYTMTVVNERGASAQCAANIIVQGTAPVGSQTITVSQGGVQQYATATGTTTTPATTTVPTATTGATTVTTTTTKNTDGTSTAVTTNADGTTSTITYDANGNVVQAVAAEASKVGTNVLEKITSALGGGQSVWERIRMVSMIALGIFFVLAIVVFVMKKMFGGGGEGGH